MSIFRWVEKIPSRIHCKLKIITSNKPESKKSQYIDEHTVKCIISTKYSDKVLYELAMDNVMNERLTIKDIIFTKALPNYKIPVPTDGYKVFSCTDCGDKFLFESSYEYHINRKSLKISYFCRHCMVVIVFYNRCKLLSHIRSHAFKYATITVTDLKIEPLPLEHFDLSILSTKTKPKNTTQNQKRKDVCYECKQNINNHGVTYKDRAAHYMQLSKEVYTCPICTFLLPTVCALEAHLRIHLNIPPYFCPECGIHLSNKVASYPFDHGCEGFKMMKSATKYKCTFNKCDVFFRPSELTAHFKTHLKKIVARRCKLCLEMWYNESQKECTRCNVRVSGTAFTYNMCPLCPYKLFKDTSVIEKHLNTHFTVIRDKFKEQVYPCMNCYFVFQHMHNLLNHHVTTHSSANLKAFLSKFTVKAHNSQKRVYHRVIKKCSKCLRSFTYRCLYENIKNLPNDCPYKCSTTEAQNTLQSNDDLEIECFLCKRKISQNWDNIKVHYAEFHKNHKCLDIQVLVKKLDKKLLSKKPRSRNRCPGALKKKSKKNKVQPIKVVLNEENVESKKIPRDPNVCIICNHNCENSQSLETHIITHRDPCMAYQCLECGKCFVVKPSFSTHLLIEHGISDVQEYIDKKPSCFNELALLKDQNVLNPPVEEPLKENQCRICREQFENSNDLEKHFRVHGMAFLLKNAHKSSSSPSP